MYRSPQVINDSPTAFSIVCGAYWYDSKGTQPHWFHKNRQDNIIIAQAMLEHGAKVNAKGAGRRTPLIASVLSHRTDMVRLLLEHGADVNAADILGEPALFYALGNDVHKDIIRLLLVYGADPNLVDRFGNTPLSMAQRSGRSDIIVLLKQVSPHGQGKRL